MKAAMSTRLIAVGAVALVVVLLATVVAVQAVIAGRDPNTTHDAATLPERITVCGRTWTRDGLGAQLTLADAKKSDGEPSVVATGPFAPCPPGPCTTVADGPCDTAVFLRVGADAYVGYELSGGP